MKMKSLGRIISKGVNARRRRGKQIIHEDNEEYRGDDKALGYTSILSRQFYSADISVNGTILYNGIPCTSGFHIQWT